MYPPIRAIAAGCALLASLVVSPVASAGAQPAPRVVRIDSRVLGEGRVLHVALPPNYDVARRRYPVVYLLDGQVRAFFEMATASVRYDLSGDLRDFAMPAQIVVGIEQGDRRQDLATNDSLFLRFLVEEVVPRIEREYRTLPYRTLVGHSLGGRFALNAMCRARGTFRGIVAISPSISDSGAAGTLRSCVRGWSRAERAVQQVVLSAGEREPRLLVGAQQFHAFLRDSAPASFRALWVPGPSLGHTDTPFTTIPAGLRFVFDRDVWEISLAAADSLAGGTISHDDADRLLRRELALLSARVGTPVPLSHKWTHRLAAIALARGTPDEAIAAARRLLEAFPEDPQSYALLADAALRRGDQATARRALDDAIGVLGKLDLFDETQRAKLRAHFRTSLEAIR